MPQDFTTGKWLHFNDTRVKYLTQEELKTVFGDIEGFVEEQPNDDTFESPQEGGGGGQQKGKDGKDYSSDPTGVEALLLPLLVQEAKEKLPRRDPRKQQPQGQKQEKKKVKGKEKRKGKERQGLNPPAASLNHLQMLTCWYTGKAHSMHWVALALVS